MKVIFTQDSGSAKVDDIKNVKDGYARYLVRYNKAEVSTSELEAAVAVRQKQKVKVLAEVKAQAQEVAKSLQKISLEFTEKADGEHLYGSINEASIAEKLAEVAKIEVKKDQVKMKEHIKTTGEHQVSVHLSEGVDAKIKVIVSSTEETDSDEKAAKKKVKEDKKED
jgi:large subunit ribosomal protein L9